VNWLGNTCDDVMSVSRRTKVGEERLSINSKCDPMGKSFKSKRKAKMATALKDNMNNSDLPVVVQSSSSSETMSRKSDSLNLKRFQNLSFNKSNHDDVPNDWMERDKEEDDNIEEEGHNEVDECSKVHYQYQNTLLQKESETDDYFVFPWDFWHTLSNYMVPENVGKFASICKTTYTIVATQSFWRRLYRRYFNPFLHSDLPTRLQPDCMSRPRGLRPSVIQMLHLTYPPFLDNFSRKSGVWPDPHSLTGNICILQSSNRVGKRSVYHYFKLKNTTKDVKIHNVARDNFEIDDEDQYFGSDKPAKELISNLSDINFNPEESCKLLQVSAAHWSSMPPVMGQKLLSVSLSVAHGMRYHKLKLLFGSPSMDARRRVDQNDTLEIVIDSVGGMKIFDWWHPQYSRQGDVSAVGVFRDDVQDLFGH